MAFQLGNFNIDEILQGVAENFDGELLYTLDQLSSASIEISSDSTDITDKNGNIVRTIYRSKTGTFNATNAFLHPQIMNAASGSPIQEASASATITMPKIIVAAAGAEVSLVPAGGTDVVDDDSIEVIGIFAGGANSKRLTKSTTTPTFSGDTGTYQYDATEDKITLPGAATGAPVNYLIKFDRAAQAGIKLSNIANVFPDTVKLTLYCSYVDPCDDQLRACYVVLPSFQASPETTISLSADEQEMDFNGSLQISYCDSQPALYYIYFPDENAVKVVSAA